MLNRQAFLIMAFLTICNLEFQYVGSLFILHEFGQARFSQRGGMIIDKYCNTVGTSNILKLTTVNSPILRFLLRNTTVH